MKSDNHVGVTINTCKPSFSARLLKQIKRSSFDSARKKLTVCFGNIRRQNYISSSFYGISKIIVRIFIRRFSKNYIKDYFLCSFLQQSFNQHAVIFARPRPLGIKCGKRLFINGYNDDFVCGRLSW